MLVTEYEQAVEELEIELKHSATIAEFKRQIGERLGLPAEQLRARTAAGPPHATRDTQGTGTSRADARCAARQACHCATSTC